MRGMLLTVLALVMLVCRVSVAVETKLLDAKAAPYSEVVTRKLSNGSETGTLQILRPAPGKMLVYVTFRLQVTWDEATDNVNYDANDFKLTEKGAAAPYRGLLDSTGEIMLQDSAHFSYYRPFDWEEKKQPTTGDGNGWWEIDAKATELTLAVGKQSATLKLTGKAEPYAPPQDFGFEVISTKLHPSIAKMEGFENKFKVEIVNEGGSILEVQFRVSPKFKAKDTEEGQQFWNRLNTQRLFLSFGKGGRGLPLGHLNSDGTLTDIGPIYFFAEDPSKPTTLVVLFPVPSNLKVFDVHYLGRKVAAGAIGN
jgi:hypothetical protein